MRRGAVLREEPGEVGRDPGAPISPEEFRASAEVRQFKKRIWVIVCILVVLAGGAGFFFYKVPFSEVMSYFSEVSEQRVRAKVFKVAGLAPARYYESKSLPGLHGQTGGEGGWEIEEEGMTYLVVEVDAAPRHFLPSEEYYKRIVAEAEYKKQRDATLDVPPLERCRFFDPEKFALVVEGNEPVRGSLISLNHGEYRGFYDSFRLIYPAGAVEVEGGGSLDEAMLLSVAFVVPEGGVDLDALWLQLDGLNPIKVPALRKE